MGYLRDLLRELISVCYHSIFTSPSGCWKPKTWAEKKAWHDLHGAYNRATDADDSEAPHEEDFRIILETTASRAGGEWIGDLITSIKIPGLHRQRQVLKAFRALNIVHYLIRNDLVAAVPDQTLAYVWWFDFILETKKDSKDDYEQLVHLYKTYIKSMMQLRLAKVLSREDSRVICVHNCADCLTSRLEMRNGLGDQIWRDEHGSARWEAKLRKDADALEEGLKQKLAKSSPQRCLKWALKLVMADNMTSSRENSIMSCDTAVSGYVELGEKS